jgi:hypothetical protein
LLLKLRDAITRTLQARFEFSAIQDALGVRIDQPMHTPLSSGHLLLERRHIARIARCRQSPFVLCAEQFRISQ